MCAEFISGYVKTNRNEGGDFAWSNNPADPGAETFMGISRVHHPTWAGWELIDQAKTYSNFPENLRYSPQLIQLVQVFYKKNFWDPMQLDLMSNQEIAEKLYDIGVNCHPAVAIKILQRALNAANRKEKLWPNLPVDGKIGQQTRDALLACEKSRRIKGLLAGIKVLLGTHYFNLMEKNENLEEFYMGWLERAMG